MLNLPGWRGLPITPNKKWIAVKDKRLARNPLCFDMPSTHTWVRSNITYRREPALADHWQAPAETLQRRIGDCEDFCILERALLLATGYKDSDIELLIVYDQLIRDYHALLFVKEHYLDNRVVKVLHISQFRDYRPFSGHRAGQSWLYGKVR